MLILLKIKLCLPVTLQRYEYCAVYTAVLSRPIPICCGMLILLKTQMYLMGHGLKSLTI